VHEYVIRGGREGYDRLQVLSRVRWPDTSALFDQIGVRAGMRCLDLGCGGGAVTLEIARLVVPNGYVVGIDMDEEKLELVGAVAAERGLTNVEFRVANVNE
jgi:ubiquinone/menaquinone biosynthesis C-methylase UbiE